METFYAFLDNIMYFLGDVTHLGYESVCVLGNMYLEFFVLLLLALFVPILYRKTDKVLFSLVLVNSALIICSAALYLGVDNIILSLHEQFDLSVQRTLLLVDINQTRYSWMSYHWMTMIQFVVVPIVLFLIVLLECLQYIIIARKPLSETKLRYKLSSIGMILLNVAVLLSVNFA